MQPFYPQQLIAFSLALFCLCMGAWVQADMVAEYRMDANQWNGTPLEVIDSSGNGFAGVAQNTAVTAGVLCNGADLSGTSTADYLDLDHRALDGLNDFTLMMWYQSTNFDRSMLVSAANAGEEKELYWLTRAGDRFEPQLFDDSDGRINIDDIDDGDWHHLAWTRVGAQNCFYVDGQLQDCNQLPLGALDVDATGFIVGQEQRDIGYNFRNNRGIEGFVDEFYVFDTGLSAVAINTIRSNNLAGNNWDGVLRSCAQAQPRAAYYFDEPSWSGVAGEVLDSSGNGYDGVAVNADTTDGLVCRAADLSTTDTSDYLSLDYQAVNGLTDFTIGFWARTANTANKAFLSAARAAQANELIFWFSSATQFRPHIENNNAGIAVPNVWNNTWHHWMWVRSGSANCIYLDGGLRGCVNLITNRIDIDPQGLVIGQEQDSVGGSFVASQSVRGEMDELLIFEQAISAAQVLEIFNNNTNGLSWDGSARVCPDFGANALQITHDGSGIYCSSEVIGVQAIDAAADVVASYASNITLDTGSGQGNWSVSVGSGTLIDAVADDGLATYSFAAADAGEAWFSLSYPAGAPILDIEVFESGQPGIRDTDLEGPLTFSPTGFTVTSGALSNPPPSPVSDPLLSTTAGAEFNVYLAAFGTTDDDPVCGIIEDYNSVVPVDMWQDTIEPVTASVSASINGTAISQSSATATTQNISFTAGQAVVIAKYKDVGRLRLNFQEDSLSGATDSFVSRPANLAIIDVTSASGAANPAAVSLAEPGFVAAGEAFRVTVDALDAEGDLTPSYGAESSPEGILVSAVNVVLPIGGRLGVADDGVLANGDAFSPQGLAGRFVNVDAIYDEVGSINLQAEVRDGSYLGTGNVTGIISGVVGRFYPSYFELVSSSLDTQCTGFSYMSAPTVLVGLDVQARNQNGFTVTNYDAGLFADPLAPITFAAEHLDNGVDLGARLNVSASAWQQGSYSLADNAADFTRLSVADGPYELMTVGFSVNDIHDGRLLNLLDMNAQASGLCALGASCNARQIGTLSVFYGRLAILPSQGPEDQNLDIGVEAQVFSNGAFIEFPQDQCSTYAGSQLSLLSYSGNLESGETLVSGPVSAVSLIDGSDDPSDRLLLSAPGVGNDGSVEVELQVPLWLRYPWFGSGEVNPRSQATFGRYRGHDRIIIWQQDP